MATLIAHQPIRIPPEEVWFGAVEDMTESRIFISDNQRSVEYTGSFSFDSFGNVFGTVTDITEVRDAELYYTLTDLSVDANELFQAIQIEADPELATRVTLSGDDTIYGSEGEDVIQVFSGDNFLLGMGGDDTLIGGDGNDVMAGDGGTNLFVYTGGEDWIADFQPNIDRLEIALDDLTTQQINDAFANAVLVDDNPVVYFGDGNSLTLNDLSISEARAITSDTVPEVPVDGADPADSPTLENDLVLFHDLSGRYGTFDPQNGDIELIGSFVQTLTDITYAGTEGVLAIDFSTIYEVDLQTSSLDFASSLPTTSANSLGFNPRPHLDGDEPYLLVADTSGEWYSIGSNSREVLSQGNLPNGYTASGDAFWYERGEGEAEWVVSAQKSRGLLGEDYAFIRYLYEEGDDGTLEFVGIEETSHEIPNLWGLAPGESGAGFYGFADSEIYRFSFEPETVTQVADISDLGFRELAGATAIPASLLGPEELEPVWMIDSTVGDDEAVFTISRDTAQEDVTVYVSTVRFPELENDGVYEGLKNVELAFAPGQATQQVTVEFLDDRATGSDLDFSLIVQADPGDPVDTYLARTGFTVPASEDTPDEPDEPDEPPTDPPDDSGDDDQPVGPVYTPTTLDLEYAARVIAYERVPEDEYVLPGGYEVDRIIETASGFHAVALTSDLAEPILGIRGTVTDTIDDIVTNLDRDGVGVGQVDEAWPEIAEWLADNPDAHVTGHSLGGAQSQLVAVEAARAGLSLASVTTFNSPGISRQRLGDTALDDATDVRHFVASGDLVSKAGLAFLPGDLRIYNFDSIDNFGFVDLPNPFSQIGNSHTGHWAQGEIQPGWFSDYDGIDTWPVAQTLTTEDLGKLNFSYLWSGGNFDAEYFALLKAINLVPKAGPPLAVAGMTRAGVETARDFFGIMGEMWRGELTLGEAALETVASAYTTARDWTIEVANTLTEWTADVAVNVWTGFSRWVAETWEQAADLGVEVWERVTEWGQQTFDNIVTHGVQIAEAALEKISDLQTAAAEGVSSAASAVASSPRTLWNFFTSDPDAEIVYADTGGNATHANSTSPAALFGGEGDGTLSSSAGSSLFASGGDATRHEMTDGGNVVWGLPSDLDGDSTLGFGATDRFSYIETAFVSDMLLRDPGSAILSVDTNGDGETDVTIRLEGDYDLDAFTAIPDMNGTAIFYGEIPADEVVEVSGAITDKSGNALPGASVHFERDFGGVPVSESTNSGEFGFDVLRDATGRVDATREFSTEDASITASDALDVLRLAVGLEPSWGPAEAQDFIAADMNRDGQVTAQDALEVLRHAVGLETEHAPQWVFLDAATDLGNIDRENVIYDTGVDFAAIDTSQELSITGILTGSMQEYA